MKKMTLLLKSSRKPVQSQTPEGKPLSAPKQPLTSVPRPVASPPPSSASSQEQSTDQRSALKRVLTATKWVLFLRSFWKVVRWFWLAVIVGVFVAYVANIFSNGANAYQTDAFNSQFVPGLFHSLFTFHPLNILIDSVLALLIILTPVSLIYSIFAPEADPVIILTKSIQNFNATFEALVLNSDKDREQRHKEYIDHTNVLEHTINALVDNHRNNLQVVSTILQSTISHYEVSLDDWNKYMQKHYINIDSSVADQITQNLQTLSQQLQSMEKILQENLPTPEEPSVSARLLPKQQALKQAESASGVASLSLDDTPTEPKRIKNVGQAENKQNHAEA